MSDGGDRSRGGIGSGPQAPPLSPDCSGTWGSNGGRIGDEMGGSVGWRRVRSPDLPDGPRVGGMEDNRRKCYRVSDIPGRLRLSIVTESHPIAVTVVNLSAGGAALTASLGYVAGLIQGQDILLRFQFDGCGLRLDMPSVVLHVGYKTGVVGVKFRNPTRVQEHLPPELKRLFNRRRSPRVRPAPDEEIAVRLERPADGFRLGSIVADISAHGLGLLCQSIACVTLRVDDVVSVAFFLPGVRHQLRFRCSVRAVTRRSAGYVVGLAFLEESDQFGRYQNSVVNYVTRRQRELLEEPA